MKHGTTIKPAKKIFDTVAFNQQHFNWYKKLIAIRKANAVLSNGNIEFIITERKKLGYTRKNNAGEIIVLFNLEKDKQVFVLPLKATYKDLLTNKIFTGNSILLSTLSAAVLKKI